MTYFNANIDAMTAYLPGEQPSAEQKVVKLNTNENPYPPSPAAVKVLRVLDMDLLRRYPTPVADAFRRTVADVLDVPPEWVLPGNGSDELIVMIARAAGGAGRDIAYPTPTFEYYLTQAHIQQAGPAEIPYDEDYNLPVEQLIAARAAVTFVASPNSPSGTAALLEQLERLAKGAAGLVVIDEAYVDFAEHNALDLARRYENVIVMRTLSKGYSLAGLRLGYAVANPAVIDALMKVKDIYNVGAVPAAVGAAAFADQEYVRRICGMVVASREKLAGELRELGWRVWPSQANFLLARPADGRAEAIYQSLKRRGILVRYFKGPRLADKLRITIGSDEQNQALVEAIRQGAQ